MRSYVDILLSELITDDMPQLIRGESRTHTHNEPPLSGRGAPDISSCQQFYQLFPIYQRIGGSHKLTYITKLCVRVDQQGFSTLFYWGSWQLQIKYLIAAQWQNL